MYFCVDSAKKYDQVGVTCLSTVYASIYSSENVCRIAYQRGTLHNNNYGDQSQLNI